MSDSLTNGRPPRDGLFRAVFPGVELRAASDEDEGTGPILFGHFARFNEWTEIDSWFEGRFLERIAPGAFRKTFSEKRDAIRVLFQHGHDPQIGNQVIAALRELREEDDGAFYEADLLDGIPPLVEAGLRAGQYGASFKFRVMREEVVDKPKRADHNPDGLPERTVREVELFELGPVTFPAYQGATAGVRSLTDEFMLDHLVRSDPERVRALLDETVTARAVVPERDPGATGEEPALDEETSTGQDREEPGEQETREHAKAAPGPSPTPLRGSKSQRRKEYWRL